MADKVKSNAVAPATASESESLDVLLTRAAVEVTRTEPTRATVRMLVAAVEGLRQTVSKLNRRTQEAEAAMADLLACNEKLASGAAWCGGNLGRKLLAYGNAQLRTERDELVTRVAELQKLVQAEKAERNVVGRQFAYLQERIRALEAALKPFALLAIDNPQADDGVAIRFWGDKATHPAVEPTMADCRRAASLIPAATEAKS